MTAIAVLASGNGSNLQVLIDETRAGRIRGRIVCVLSNHADARALERARAAGIETHAVEEPDRATRDRAMADFLDRRDIELVCLAGYMRVLTAEFIDARAGHILNVHPSLLPAYPGEHTHRRVLAAGEAEHGPTVHFATAALDEGPRVIQASLRVQDGDTSEAGLQERVRDLEHRIFPLAVEWFCIGALRMADGAAWLHGERLDEPVFYRYAEDRF